MEALVQSGYQEAEDVASEGVETVAAWRVAVIGAALCACMSHYTWLPPVWYPV